MENVREEFIYLNRLLRDSGKTKMYGATPFLMHEFGLSNAEAKNVLAEWMRWIDEDTERGGL
jgi:chromosome segregation and condensation protein ScpB